MKVEKTCLNSTMVRLKLLNSLPEDFQVIGLNSTMVRLKLVYFYRHDVTSSESQFHYGSIKTNLLLQGWNYGPQSQFHYGSIKTGNIRYRARVGNEQSQFHYGSIKTYLPAENGKIIDIVSIPLWFD